MARSVLLADGHFGSRSDSLQFDAYFEKFYRDIFFPYIDQHNIKTLFHLGDIFDRRKYINFKILDSCKRYFFDELLKRDVQVYAILGNHDVFYRNTNKINSPELVLREYSNIHLIVNSPETIHFSGCDILMVPWINSENQDECLTAIKNNTSPVCFGHFEIKGFEMHRGMPSQEGFEMSEFKKFDLVCSGHFHHKSTYSNINYLGSPYEMTWVDFDDPRGFHVFDSETREIEFVQNPYSMFHKVYYDDTKEVNIKPSDFTQTCVKLIVVNKKDFYKFDKVVDGFYNANLIELKILEDLTEFELEEDSEQINVEDTMTLLSEHVDSLESQDLDKGRLKTVLKTLYVEAQGVQRD